ncbi:MAG: hypothetical protein ACK5MH_02690 [Bacteroidales bacterium]|nr:hypothetical protein [Bacteroidales bacterium]
MKTKITLSLSKIELIFGILYLTSNLILRYNNKLGLISMISSLMIIAFFVIMIKNRMKHIYYKDKPIMFILSLFYKVYAAIAVIFIMVNYPMRDIILLIGIVLAVIYIVLAYFNNRRYYEMLNAYIYWQTAGALYFLLMY